MPRNCPDADFFYRICHACMKLRIQRPGIPLERNERDGKDTAHLTLMDSYACKAEAAVAMQS